jgi:hypothetical protein
VSREERAVPTGRRTPAFDETEASTLAPAAAVRQTLPPARLVAPAAEPRARTTPRTEPPAATRLSRTRNRMRADSLASRAAAELVYVTDDLRRIGIVSVVMLGVLLALWLLMAVVDPLGVY